MTDPAIAPGVLEKCARIFDVFASPPFRFSYSDIADRVEMPRSSTHRMLRELARLGLLGRAPEGKTFVIGPRLARLIHYNLAQSELDRVFRTVLERLSNDVGEAAFGARLRGVQVELFAVSGPSNPKRFHIHPGTGWRPLNACSSAKAIIAFQDKDFIDSIARAPMVAFTEKTLTTPEQLSAEFARVRKQGFAVCDEEIDHAVSSIAYPIQLVGTGVIYSVGFIGLKERRTQAFVQDLQVRLGDASRQLSRLLDGCLV